MFRRFYGFIFTAAARIYGARDVKGTVLWRHENLLFLDVTASFSRTIFKRRDCVSRLNVFIVKFLRKWSLFPVFNKPFFGVIFLMVQNFSNSTRNKTARNYPRVAI